MAPRTGRGDRNHKENHDSRDIHENRKSRRGITTESTQRRNRSPSASPPLPNRHKNAVSASYRNSNMTFSKFSRSDSRQRQSKSRSRSRSKSPKTSRTRRRSRSRHRKDDLNSSRTSESTRDSHYLTSSKFQSRRQSPDRKDIQRSRRKRSRSPSFSKSRSRSPRRNRERRTIRRTKSPEHRRAKRKCSVSPDRRGRSRENDLGPLSSRIGVRKAISEECFGEGTKTSVKNANNSKTLPKDTKSERRRIITWTESSDDDCLIVRSRSRRNHEATQNPGSEANQWHDLATIVEASRESTPPRHELNLLSDKFDPYIALQNLNLVVVLDPSILPLDNIWMCKSLLIGDQFGLGFKARVEPTQERKTVKERERQAFKEKASQKKEYQRELELQSHPLQRVMTKIHDMCKIKGPAPYDLVHQAHMSQSRVELTLWSSEGKRGKMTGIIQGYDRHFNLVLVDVEETYTIFEYSQDIQELFIISAAKAANKLDPLNSLLNKTYDLRMQERLPTSEVGKYQQDMSVINMNGLEDYDGLVIINRTGEKRVPLLVRDPISAVLASAPRKSRKLDEKLLRFPADRHYDLDSSVLPSFVFSPSTLGASTFTSTKKLQEVDFETESVNLNAEIDDFFGTGLSEATKHAAESQDSSTNVGNVDSQSRKDGECFFLDQIISGRDVTDELVLEIRRNVKKVPVAKARKLPRIWLRGNMYSTVCILRSN